MFLREEEEQKDIPDLSDQEINQINQEDNNISLKAIINQI